MSLSMCTVKNKFNSIYSLKHQTSIIISHMNVVWEFIHVSLLFIKRFEHPFLLIFMHEKAASSLLRQFGLNQSLTLRYCEKCLGCLMQMENWLHQQWKFVERQRLRLLLVQKTTFFVHTFFCSFAKKKKIKKRSYSISQSNE